MKNVCKRCHRMKDCIGFYCDTCRDVRAKEEKRRPVANDAPNVVDVDGTVQPQGEETETHI